MLRHKRGHHVYTHVYISLSFSPRGPADELLQGDPFCDPKNPVKVQFSDISAAQHPKRRPANSLYGTQVLRLLHFKMSSPRSLQELAIIKTVAESNLHYEKLLPKGTRFRILCDNFNTSYLKLKFNFIAVGISVPQNAIRLYDNGTINLEVTLNNAKNSISKYNFFILAILTGIDVDIEELHRELNFQNRWIALKKAADILRKTGDNFLNYCVSTLCFDIRLSGNPSVFYPTVPPTKEALEADEGSRKALEVLKAAVHKAVELDSISALKFLLGRVDQIISEKTSKFLFSGLPCRPTDRVKAIIASFK
ncbi:hypothetical protein L596_019894 [Steinernema carpocapsae]|uniref:Uncharacterized protein n=1 Tax=Steinernema carpocapsae TaxID=34508 RepID=A0A4V6A0R1_STECR|nr:hypothetical protein L596_019894 [Steinernema carpocapsae]